MAGIEDQFVQFEDYIVYTRVQALGYVVLLEAMIAVLLELRIRKVMVSEKTAVSTRSRTLDRPTVRVLLDMLNTIQVFYRTYDDRIERHSPHDIPPDVLRLSKYVGYDSRIFLKTRTQKPI